VYEQRVEKEAEGHPTVSRSRILADKSIFLATLFYKSFNIFIDTFSKVSKALMLLLFMLYPTFRFYTLAL
jgi:hypothetical protein